MYNLIVMTLKGLPSCLIQWNRIMIPQIPLKKTYKYLLLLFMISVLNARLFKFVMQIDYTKK